MAIRATRRVTDNNHTVTEHAEADESSFAVVLAHIFDLEVGAVEDMLGILEVQASSRKRCFTLYRIVACCH